MSACFFMFGFGYTAKVLAPLLLSQGFNVIGTTRAVATQRRDIQGVKLIDFDCPNMEDYIGQATHLLISIPPASTMGDLVLIKYAELIKKQAGHLQWIGYLSSTGVYGDHQGRWVDENTPCIAHTPVGLARLKAEQDWISAARINQLPLHIFRLSGIYGPERNVIQRLLAGKEYSLFKEGQVFSRIHVEDIASTLVASINLPNPLSIYNISDDEPAPAHIVDEYAASLMQQDPLPLIAVSDFALSAMEQEFYSNNRRVSNLKIKRELHVILKYPTYREGLTQIWRDHVELKKHD